MKISIEINSAQELVDLATLLAALSATTAPAPAKPAAKAKVNGAAKPDPVKEPEQTTAYTAAEEQVDEGNVFEEQTQADQGTSGENNPFADDTTEAPPKQEAKKAKAKKLTREDANAAFKTYVDTFGQAAAMEDATIILNSVFPGVKKIRDIPDGQDNFAKIIGAVTEAISKNSFGRSAVAGA